MTLILEGRVEAMRPVSFSMREPGVRASSRESKCRRSFQSFKSTVAKLACAGDTLIMRKKPRDPMILLIRFL